MKYSNNKTQVLIERSDLKRINDDFRELELILHGVMATLPNPMTLKNSVDRIKSIKSDMNKIFSSGMQIHVEK